MTVHRAPHASSTDPVLWLAVGMVGLADLGAMLAMGWTVAWRPVVVLGGLLAVLCAIGRVYHVTGRSDALARVGYAAALLLTLTFVCQATTYVAGVDEGAFRDEALRAADAVLGFSWTQWAAWLHARPALDQLATLVYASHLPESAIVVVFLAARDPNGATPFLRAFWLAFGAALLGMLVVPALGALPTADWIPVHRHLQAGTFTAFDLFQTTGLISMPSFHAVLAVLIPVACWPYRRLRWPVLTFNAAMWCATIPIGGHYLVDVLAGTALAFASARAAGLTAASQLATPPSAPAR